MNVLYFSGVEEVYELLCILDFNNVRKRMSVILRKDGKIRLYCKGKLQIRYSKKVTKRNFPVYLVNFVTFFCFLRKPKLQSSFHSVKWAINLDHHNEYEVFSFFLSKFFRESIKSGQNLEDKAPLNR